MHNSQQKGVWGGSIKRVAFSLQDVLMLRELRVVLCRGSPNVNVDITAVGQERSDIADTGAAV